MTMRKSLFIVLLFALVASVGVGIMHRNEKLKDDTKDYHDLAVTLINQHAYESTYRPPVYPAFVALVYAVAGPRPVAVYLAQAVLFVATLMIVFRIALHVTCNERTALLTVALSALWPPFYAAVATLLGEMLNGFFVAAALLALLVAIERKGYFMAGVAGILCGVNALIKPTILPFIAVAALIILVGAGSRRRRIGLAATIIVAAAVVVTPWVIRNYSVTGHLVPVSTGTGMNLFLGNHPMYYDGSLPRDTKFSPEVARQLEGRTELEKDRILMAAAKAVMKEDPVRAAGLFCRKFSSLWLGSLGAHTALIGPNKLHIGTFGIPAMAFLQVPLFIAAVLGWFCLSRDSRRRAYPILALLVVMTLAYVVLLAERRYAVPLEYYKIMFAGVAVSRVLRFH